MKLNLIAPALILIFLCLGANSQASEKCQLDGKMISANLSLSYNDFDQTRGAGWRILADRECYFEGALLIDLYHLQKIGTLLDWQDRVLFWHAGQLYGHHGIYELALSRFTNALNPNEKPDDDFKWNAYARASIAFLKNDKAELIKQRDELAKATDPGSAVNLKIVNRMVDCFGQSYLEVYRGNCHPKAQ